MLAIATQALTDQIYRYLMNSFYGLICNDFRYFST